MKIILILYLLSVSLTANAQKFKIETTQACLIMKDITSMGGLYEAFDWMDGKGEITYDQANKIIQVDYAKGGGIRYYIISLLKQIETKDENTLLFSVLETFSKDGYKSSNKGTLKLRLAEKEQEKRSVIIAETDYTISFIRGKNAYISQ